MLRVLRKRHGLRRSWRREPPGWQAGLVAGSGTAGVTDLFPITTADMIADMRRELIMRERVYPKLVAAATLKQDEADRRIAIVKAIIARLGEA